MKWIARWCLIFSAVSAFAQKTSVDLGSDVSVMTCRVFHPFRSVVMVSTEAMYRVRADTSSRTLSEVEGLVDMASFRSEDAGWDARVRGVIDTTAHPVASFESTEVKEDGDSVNVVGELLLHGVRKYVNIRARSVWSDSALSVSGRFDLSLSAYGISRPSILLLPVADTLLVSFRMKFRLK